MITIKINIPQWKDITKWFWDKFCSLRRKDVDKSKCDKLQTIEVPVEELITNCEAQMSRYDKQSRRYIEHFVLYSYLMGAPLNVKTKIDNGKWTQVLIITY